MTEFEQQYQRVKNDRGIIAALDQSGGSTPKTLGLYGIGPDAWTDDEGMFSVMHQMRARIMQSNSFNAERVLGAILFDGTLERSVSGIPTAQYLWKEKNIVPFLKVDKGLADETNGVQVMNPIPGLAATLATAKAAGVFGTKMRSVIKQANAEGINAIVDQQFEIGKEILAAGLMPILEPEIDINCPDKLAAETLLRDAIVAQLDALDADQQVMLKLTLPENDNHYKACVDHPKVLRVVALSGGYARDEANKRLKHNLGVIASFSRALAEGLNATQSDQEFDTVMNTTIDSIYNASAT